MSVSIHSEPCMHAYVYMYVMYVLAYVCRLFLNNDLKSFLCSFNT